MTLSRRDFLKIGGLSTVALSATSCSSVSRGLAQMELPDRLSVSSLDINEGVARRQSGTRLSSAERDRIRRLMNRAGYGPRPGDLARAAAIGFESYLEEQLNPEMIDDLAADILVRSLNYYHMDPSYVLSQDVEDVAQDLAISTLGRSIYSKRQLFEAMVEFWSDHFNIYIRKNRLTPSLKLIDDRDVIRPHALGKFPELLTASSQSPAMLVYLDNVDNEKGAPNENYARELLELHTLGVDAGYNQADVEELARALTGWGIQRRGPRQGEIRFFPGDHDDEGKKILGLTLPAGQSEADVKQILDHLASHQATARTIASKLVRRFVADDPPEELVQQVASTYRDSGGDIRSMLRRIFLSEEFFKAPDKLKRPYTYAISTLRALNGDVGNYRALSRWLKIMGQPLFQWPAPDGYPDDSRSWTGNLLSRWNFALALLGNQIPGSRVPLNRLLDSARSSSQGGDELELLASFIYGRTLDTEERAYYERIGKSQLPDQLGGQRLAGAVALMIASPAFQWS